MIAIMLWQIAFNIFFPYIIIYLQHYLQFDITNSSIAIAVIILIGGIAMAWPFGILVDRWGRKPVALTAVVVEMVGLILFSLTKSLVPLIITGILWIAPFTAWTIATSTWSKDLFPEDKRGQFAGFYLFFWVMLPMILGPLDWRLAQQHLWDQDCDRWTGGHHPNTTPVPGSWDRDLSGGNPAVVREST